ncbi:MAG: hypothetical protein IPK82_05995 [Polyangiaceae bacterium]|nr:hypothetical protein [Polyangiaceae bacterium]
MAITKINVRVVASMPSEMAKREFADWVGAHRELLERLPMDAITVMVIRGEDNASGRIVEKLRYELSIDDVLGELLAGSGTRRLEVALPAEPTILASWWSSHPSLAAFLTADDVLSRDVRSELPVRFYLDELNAGLLCPQS